MTTKRFQYVKIGVAVVVLFFALSVRAIDRADGAEHRLEKVEIFAMEPVGFAGATSAGERDYRLIMSNSPEQALQLLNELYEKGNVQARAYALVGFRKLDRARFQELYTGISNSKATVQVESGCIIASKKLQEIAREIDERKFPYDK